MRSVECTGFVQSSRSGKKIDGRLEIYANSLNKWFRARGLLIVEMPDVPKLEPSEFKKWVIGVFVCNKLDHNKFNHAYSLSASDSGEIEFDEKSGKDMSKIKVSVTRIDLNEEKLKRERPKIDKL